MYRIAEEKLEGCTYLIVEPESGTILDEVSKNMMMQNQDKIAGLIPFIYSKLDGQIQLEYDLTNHSVYSDFYHIRFDQKRLIHFFKNVIDALLSLNEFALPSKELLLQLNYCYVDKRTEQVRFILLPFEDMKEYSISQFFQDLVYSMPGKVEPEASQCLMSIMGYINEHLEKLVLESLRDFLVGLEAKYKVPEVIQKPMSVPELVQKPVSVPETGLKSKRKESTHSNLFDVVKGIFDGKKEKKKEPKSSKQLKKQMRKTSMGFARPGQDENKQELRLSESMQSLTSHPRYVRSRKEIETIDLDAYEANELEPKTEEMGASLYRIATGEIIDIRTSPFRIGRLDDGSNDYAMSQNGKISSNHIEIEERVDGYYLHVKKNKNGTHINGGNNLPIGQSVRLYDGDIITIANEKLEFHTSI